MNTWNYQVGFKTKTYKSSTHMCSDVVREYGIVEVFRNDEGEIQAFSEEFQAPHGENLEELIEDLGLMLKDASDRQVLDLDNQKTLGFNIEGLFIEGGEESE